MTAEMKAAAARVQGAVRASGLPPYDRRSNTGFWLQLAARQAGNSVHGPVVHEARDPVHYSVREACNPTQP